MTTISIAEVEMPRLGLVRKKIGTPAAAASAKQMSCRFVRLNMTFVLTRFRSFGTGTNIKSFERTANKYGIDYALKKDTSEQPPRYLVFFKGRDVDVMTQAFKEFSAKTVKQKEKQSLKQKLSRSREQSKAQHKEKVKVKTKDRGVEL